MDTSKFCILPFIHLEARADGTVSPCSFSCESVLNENGEPYSLYKNTLGEAYESTWMDKLRQDLLRGKKNSNCTKCWTEEAANGVSRRLKEMKKWRPEIKEFLEVYQEKQSYNLEKPKSVDLKLGNLCNLKCRICSPHFSVQWAKEAVNYPEVNKWNMPLQKLLHSWPESNAQFWAELESWLPHIQELQILGGEPFLIKRQFEVIKRSVELGYAKNQTLRYYSNGTVKPHPELEKIIPHFKLVKLLISVDGVGEQFEYQRFPASWPLVYENILEYKKIFKNDLGLVLAVNAMNVFYLPEIFESLDHLNLKIFLNYVMDPSALSIKSLGPIARDVCAKKLMHCSSRHVEMSSLLMVLRMLKDRENGNLSHFVMNEILLMDKVRKQSFNKTFPEWAGIISKDLLGQEALHGQL